MYYKVCSLDINNSVPFLQKKGCDKNKYVFSFQEGGFWNSQSSSKISQKIFLGNLSLFSYLFFFFYRGWEILINILISCDEALKITNKFKKYTVYSECLFLSFTLLKIKFVNLFHWSLSCFFSVDVR